MVSSPTMISIGSVFFFVGMIAILVSGFTTDWMEYEVDRRAILGNQDVAKKIGDSFLRNPIYFARTYGLYHICFPNNVPTDIGSYSYMTGTCISNPDLTPEDAVFERYSTNQKLRFYALRACLVLFAVGLVTLTITLCVGFTSCWSQRTRWLKSTAFLLCITAVFFVIVMCLFHLIKYWDMYVLKMSPFMLSWDTSLRQSTAYRYGLSYYCCWCGIGFLLVSAGSFFYAVAVIHKERDQAFENKHHAYMMSMGADKQVMPYSNYGSPYSVAPYGGYPGYYSKYPTMSGNSYYGYLTYGH